MRAGGGISIMNAKRRTGSFWHGDIWEAILKSQDVKPPGSSRRGVTVNDPGLGRGKAPSTPAGMNGNLKQELEGGSPSFDRFQLQSPPQRRPRGFAATASSEGISGKGRREREREKERTKLRERHRRAITSRMLAGLRQYGNFTLPARADMNDVLAALAREAGWTVEPDGTTYRTSSTPQLEPYPVRSLESPHSTTTLKKSSFKSAMMCQPTILRVDDSLSPTSLDSIVIAENDTRSGKFENPSSINSPESLEPDQTGLTATSCIPVYIILSAGIINNFCQLVDPERMKQELRHLKSLNVDGVVVYCWWGIIEGWTPQKYLWTGYRELFNMIRELKLKLQVIMAFHEYGGNESYRVHIPLPKWILEIGADNHDIFFTDREGRINTECLSWGIDKERVLRGRTGMEVYFDFMRSFRMEFDDLFLEGIISAVEIGMGASGELKYPSFPERVGWKYPGVGEFQCYDKYLRQSLQKAAESRGQSFWARGPDNAGEYNSKPSETGFFCDRGDYDSYYGRFFLQWYSKILINHADHVLSLATLAFEGTQMVVKVPTVYWWYTTCGHAAELTAGFYNPTNQDGYAPVFQILKKHSVTLKFICSGFPAHTAGNNDALADAGAICWQVLNCAWDQGLNVAGENMFPSWDREGFTKIIETSRPRNHPDNRHLVFFAYKQSSPASVERELWFSQLDYFVKAMHGNVPVDL